MASPLTGPKVFSCYACESKFLSVRGKLLHHFDFVRTQEDYKSRLMAVKDGPVRVIRRTDNRIRMLWQFRTLSFDIDYLLYAHSFCMDTRMDFPFRPGLFFSELSMTSTIDGNEDPALPPFVIFTKSNLEGLAVDGKMSEAEQTLNASRDTGLIVSCAYGQILFRLVMERDFPVQQRIYLEDDRNRPDPPENIPGQFGNVGFQLTGWEKVDTAPHRMVYQIYMIRDIPVQQGFEILTNAPSFAE